MFAGLYARLIGIVAILAVVAGAWFYVHHLQAEVADLTTAKAQLEGKLLDQNNAIDALKADADARLKVGAEKLALAEAEAAKAKGRATIIYKTKPSTPGDACKSALDLINGGAQ